ncbi:hypothetical protein B0H12DRAFT_1068629 [Mycena haematopus]|nr:hypothetical protein B0H12DRAFT_1068629 [Mycena haematopus]
MSGVPDRHLAATYGGPQVSSKSDETSLESPKISQSPSLVIGIEFIADLYLDPVSDNFTLADIALAPLLARMEIWLDILGRFKAGEGKRAYEYFVSSDRFGPACYLGLFANTRDRDRRALPFSRFLKPRISGFALRVQVFDSKYTSFSPTAVMPINDLPLELLGLIFLQCRNAADLYPMLSSDAPLNLSETCKLWADVSYNLPPLWSKLKVVASDTASRPPVQVVEKWMALSGASPLSLSLVCQRQPDTVARALAAADPELSRDLGVLRVVELFLLNMYRWRVISLDFSQYAPPVKYPISLTAQGASQLERFEIYPFSWSPLLGALAVPWLTGAFSAPLLHSFTSRPGKFPPAFFSQVPWVQLTYVRLETGLSDLACLFVLQSAPNLIECHLLNVHREFHEDVPTFDPMVPPVLPHLATLDLASQMGFDRLFRLLVAPDLSTLEIGTRSTQMRWDHSHFMAFLRRSGCSITSLTMRDLFVSRLADTELSELLTHVSDSLTHLAITSDIPGTPVGIRNALLRALSYQPVGHVLCPQLERLALQMGAFVNDGELGKMVESRWAGHQQAPARIARLQHIDIVCTTETHVADVLILNELLKQGLEGKVH